VCFEGSFDRVEGFTGLRLDFHFLIVLTNPILCVLSEAIVVVFCVANAPLARCLVRMNEGLVQM
jgi:hypothetical protein